MWFRVAIDKLVAALLPTLLRKPRLMAWLGALLYPVEKRHRSWLQMRADNLYKLEHTGQVGALTQALNDRLDPVLRRIYIAGSQHEHVYLYMPAEKKPTYLGGCFLYRKVDYADSGADFIVYVPQGIFQQKWFALTALIDFYKVASKRYKITVL